MISVAEATYLIAATIRPLPPETRPLAQAQGRVLREPLHADRDFPPFDRVAMDGVALAFEALAAGQRAFGLERVQLAGQPPAPLQNPAAAVEIMTGAALPPGTDTVIRYEDLLIGEEADGRRVATVQVLPPARGHNVHRRATDRHQGELLLPAGTHLGPAELAVAATVGAAEVTVTRRPRLAVVSTGDELVAISQVPLPHQIRRSNGLMLQAAAQAAGAEADLFHFDDDPAVLRRELPALLRGYDALVLSGGVSKGLADFLPAALREAGTRELFHEVRQRPGKPLWFGQYPEGAVVFALPGNPVSSFVNFYRYVQPWLRAVQQPQAAPEPAHYAALAADVTFRPPLTHFLLVRLTSAPDGRLLAHPLARTQNSGDLASLLHCDGFVELPAEREQFTAGEALPLWRFR
ncbi:molybdopterin molybdotransferase MoeA [Hymenobacter sp. B81]|uniref:molybdopterin molybdotransferase MoeA n=1 Tax=Hymenobacter sp. B81 TaxID=3344878 RepID=UPI0037DDDA19